MKPFESFMASHIEDYLFYRKSIGYLCMKPRRDLHVFDRYLVENNTGWHDFHPAFFLEMRSRIRQESRSVNSILYSIRSFFSFLVRREVLANNPLIDIPPLKENTIVPFVLSPEQVDQLLHAISRKIRKSERYFLIDLATYLAIVLMARCGMRISEPIKLLRCHYRQDDATLFIEKTKFGKDRLIPVPKEVAAQIENYLAVRDKLKDHDDNPYLLAGRKQSRLNDNTIRSVFARAIKEIGLHQNRKVVGNINFNPPTPHSLRHSFAVNTLKSVWERGQSAQNALPVLAAYMGHKDYKCTSVYLRVADAISRKELVDFSLWQKVNV
jgi:integrase/recombinase XerD